MKYLPTNDLGDDMIRHAEANRKYLQKAKQTRVLYVIKDTSTDSWVLSSRLMHLTRDFGGAAIFNRLENAEKAIRNMDRSLSYRTRWLIDNEYCTTNPDEVSDGTNLAKLPKFIVVPCNLTSKN